MERSAKPTDAAKAILDLIQSASGVRVKTRGGKKHDHKDGKKPTKHKKQRDAPARKTRQQLADENYVAVDPLPPVIEPPPPKDFSNPMLARGDIIIGGLNGAAIRLPMGTEGQVLGIKNGQIAWVSVVDVGADPNYTTYFDGSEDVALTYYDGVTDYALWA